MTPKEALKGIKQSIAEHLHLRTGVSVEKHFEYLQYDTEIDIVDEALTELEELKRDVARYFDLGHIEEPSTEQFEEYLKLTEKLLKVGAKNV